MNTYKIKSACFDFPSVFSGKARHLDKSGSQMNWWQWFGLDEVQ